MAIVKPVKDNIITFAYTPEKDDEFSCAWARFKLDLDRYSMSIESDCGNYTYTGWTPTHDRESFLHLCQRFDKEYLLEKLSKRTVVNSEETWKYLCEQIEEELSELELKTDWNEMKERVKDACYEYQDVDNTYREIEEALSLVTVDSESGNLKSHISDLWEIISNSIITDYPAGAKTIIDIYMKYIVPAIKGYSASRLCREEELLINSIEHAIEVSKGYTRDLIRASGITPEELDAIGYDEVNFPELHAWANGVE